jgi:hypothetical protein
MEKTVLRGVTNLNMMGVQPWSRAASQLASLGRAFRELQSCGFNGLRANISACHSERDKMRYGTEEMDVGLSLRPFFGLEL